MNPELIVLRVIHIVGGVLWAGTAMFVSFFLLPAMGAAGPAGAPVMGALVKRKLFVIVPTVGVIVMLAGLRLLWLAASAAPAQYFASRVGITYVAGGVCALIAFTTFLLVNHPAIGRMGALQQQMAQAAEADRGAIMAEMAAVRARAAMGSRISAVLLTATVIAMAVSRYL